MAERVKAKRAYNSPRRQEQASATRLQILDAAQRLFESNGYTATAMTAIAREARVSLKTVYVVFETKSGLLLALWNHRLRGGAEDVPMAQHPWYLEALEDPDPQRQLRLNARNSREGKLRIAAIAEVIRSAAPSDPELAALWQRIGQEYHANQQVIVESLHAKRALARGLSVERATDVLWTLNHLNTWQLLVREQGWTPDEYERWSADAACTLLLAAPRKR
jgi:AcrR family transcriptional regulator